MSYSYSNNAAYRDAGCPSQCATENSYMSLMGNSQCSENEKGEYSNPFSSSATPSYCNFYDGYANVNNIYSPSTMYIPPQSAARIYNYPIGVNSDFMVTQPQIVNWNGETEFNNLSSMPVVQDPSKLVEQVNTTIAEVEAAANGLMTLKTTMGQIVAQSMSVSGQGRVDLANKGIEVAKQSKELYSQIMNKISFLKASVQNVAPYTVRDVKLQSVIDRMLTAAKKMDQVAQSANVYIASNADMLVSSATPVSIATNVLNNLNVAKATPVEGQYMSPNTKMGVPEAERFARLRRRGY